MGLSLDGHMAEPPLARSAAPSPRAMGVVNTGPDSIHADPAASRSRACMARWRFKAATAAGGGGTRRVAAAALGGHSFDTSGARTMVRLTFMNEPTSVVSKSSQPSPSSSPRRAWWSPA
jgi:hypothetical protein